MDFGKFLFYFSEYLNPPSLLESSDGIKFAISEAACNQSVTIKDLIGTIGTIQQHRWTDSDFVAHREKQKEEEIWAYDYNALIAMALLEWDLEFFEKLEDEVHHGRQLFEHQEAGHILLQKDTNDDQGQEPRVF
ncbi:hypothetical protein B9Z55_028006 [Caenorhabditis nigoni]|uniref:Uncharacterized protein n=1 Tax=Caenorhabditis nigoni TaxID=1611254 RepID=A0A2G5SDZ6_9PELO|nr:hypothetical protein B9Z55_028006 [Caenorhabditis nigoni]